MEMKATGIESSAMQLVHGMWSRARNAESVLPPRVAKLLWSRPKHVFVAFIVSFALMTLLYFNVDSPSLRLPGSHPFSTQNSSATAGEGLPYPESAVQLWNELLPLLDRFEPQVAEVGEPDAHSGYYEVDKEEEDLMDKIQMLPGDILKMREAHAGFSDSIAEVVYRPTKDAAPRGIVSTAGGFYFPVFMVSLRMLRRTGCTLPVEVFLANEEEYEAELCETILPSMNAKCLILSDILNHANSGTAAHEISKYQLKIFSILFSTFDEVLFLDGDSFPLHNPEQLFLAEPFTSSGMVTWPDFWASTISPAYYLISGQPPQLTSARQSTESGQILFSKAKHYSTLLLVAYYNYYGPSHYYNLLCQGGAGRGDKGTFVPAVMALNLPFYQVSEKSLAVGHAEPDHFYIFAIIQNDPIEDYKLTSKGLWRIKDESVAERPRPFFLHTNTPKWNPLNVLDHAGAYDLTQKANRQPSAAYSEPQESVALIPGVERKIWDEVLWVACELEHDFKDWKDKSNICAKVRAHYDTLPKVDGT